MTLGAKAWPVLNGGLGLSSMHITQYQGQHNYSLHWRDGHVTGGHPTVFGSMIGNHSMMPRLNTPHFNWGIDFEGTVTASKYSNWATPVKPGGKLVDCTWITFCTNCCPKAGPGCCCVSPSDDDGDQKDGGGSSSGGGGMIEAGVGHPPDTPQPRVVQWCKHPYCPQQPPALPLA
jgi:hypothetical protein